MAVSKAKKIEIITDWQIGEFKTIIALATHHKISSKTAKKILGDTKKSSLKQIVDLGITYYTDLYSTQYSEVLEYIEKSVNDEIDSIIEFKKTENLIANSIFHINLLLNKMVKQNTKKIIVGGEVVETELSSKDLLNCVQTADQSLISMGLAQRYASSPVLTVVNNISATAPQKKMSDFYTRGDDGKEQ